MLAIYLPLSHARAVKRAGCLCLVAKFRSAGICQRLTLRGLLFPATCCWSVPDSLASIKFEGGWMFGFLLVLRRFLQIKLLQVSIPILSSGSMPFGVRDKLLDFSS